MSTFTRFALAFMALSTMVLILAFMRIEAYEHEPLVCSVSEDSQLRDCDTREPLDYRNGGWYRK